MEWVTGDSLNDALYVANVAVYLGETVEPQ